jgi:hypothetical protein
MALLSGVGEANAGAWIHYFSFWPYALVAKIFGLQVRFPPENAALVTFLQALGYAVAGAIIDFLLWRFPKSDSQ